MKVKKHKGEKGTKWQTLILSRYEARILATQTEELLSMANGDINGVCIAGALILLELEK